MKVKVSKDLKFWNGTWDYEYSQLAPTVKITMTRGEEEMNLELSPEDGVRFNNGEAMEVYTTALDLIKVKAFTGNKKKTQHK